MVNSVKETVHPSPTNFDAARIPRTVSESVFIRAVTEAQSLRVQIGKNLQLCDRHVKELKDLDQVMTGEGEDNSD